MKSTEITGISPQQLIELINQNFKNQIDDLKKEFQPKQPSELLTRTEVIEMFKIDPSTLHNWTYKYGLFPCFGIGGRVFYKRSDLELALMELNG